jgi:hypothetical protein
MVTVWHKKKFSSIYSWDLDSRQKAIAWKKNSEIWHANIDAICERLNDPMISVDDVQKFREYILYVKSHIWKCENNLPYNFKVRMLDICTLVLFACNERGNSSNLKDSHSTQFQPYEGVYEALGFSHLKNSTCIEKISPLVWLTIVA